MAETAAAAVTLMAIHLFAGRLQFLDAVPRSQWLSAAGGVSVAYVCLHLLPEIAGVATELAYWYLLSGLVFFYTLQRIVRAQAPGESTRAYWLSLGSFTLYNALIGYGLTQRRDLLWFTVAMGLHFVVNDHGLRKDHGRTYQQSGRWLLALAIAIGTGAGWALSIPPDVIELLFAVLAGGVVLNVFKEELPDERESRPAPFVAAALAFALLLHFSEPPRVAERTTPQASDVR